MINMNIKITFICCVVYILKADMKCHNIMFFIHLNSTDFH